jgi:tetraacyldisaccharide 4'-kinase
VLVSDGVNVLSNPSDGGDEPFLLAQNLKGIAAVISDPDRVAAGQWAIRELGSDVVVLDDGFQYLRLARDLNILTVDATNPWGGGSLLPYGRMREPKSGISRADCVVITRSDQGESAPIEIEVRKSLGTQPILLSQMKTKGIRELTSTSLEVSALGDQAVAAFCAIGNPKSFFEHLRGEGYSVVLTRGFPDHHNYDQSDVDRLIKDAKRHGAKHLITTSKDAVKLQSLSFDVPCHILDIEISIKDTVKILEVLHKAVPFLHSERDNAKSTRNLK